MKQPTVKPESIALWDSVERTDPAYTKQFNRGGGFSGTSINATYMAKKATTAFGPMGVGWGVDIVGEDFISGNILDAETGEKTIIHRLQIKLWYLYGGVRGEITHFGQTTFVGKNKYGVFTDEEAPKKSLTDATNKALSMLGFGGDIFMGLYDDQEYREEVTNISLLEKADDKDAEKARIQQEYIEWRMNHLELVKTAVSRAELKTLHTMMTRKMARHNDTTGLRILEEIKAESLTRIEGKESANDNAA
jgi:hypothetical protein